MSDWYYLLAVYVVFSVVYYFGYSGSEERDTRAAIALFHPLILLAAILRGLWWLARRAKIVLRVPALLWRGLKCAGRVLVLGAVLTWNILTYREEK